MVIKDIDSKLIITKFAMHGYNVHPTAVEILRKEAARAGKFSLDYVISQICKTANGSFIITPDDVLPVLKTIAEEKKERKAELKPEPVMKPKPELERRDVNVLKDITGYSGCEGGVDDFIAYFNSRFEKLSKILKARINPLPISSIGRVKSERVEVIGMVNSVRESSSGNVIVELEDKTDRIRVIASGKLKEVAMELLGDEVIGVVGTLKGRTIIADRIIFPDVPINGRKSKRTSASLLFRIRTSEVIHSSRMSGRRL